MVASAHRTARRWISPARASSWRRCRYSVYRPVGGDGEFPKALVKFIQAHGGDVIPSAPVQQVVVENSKVRGAHLVDGREFFADNVIAAISPLLLFNNLISDQHVSDKIREEIAAISVCGSNINSMTSGVAYAERPAWNNDPERTSQLLGTSILVADDLPLICDWISAAGTGSTDIAGKRPPGWFITPSVQDRTLVPERKPGEKLSGAMYVYLPVVANRLANNARWGKYKNSVFGAALDMLHAKAPGLAQAEIGRFAVSPDDLATYSYQCSHPFHLDMSLAQMGPWRPTPSLTGYRTPIKGLYHSGAGALPMGTVNGWSGRTVARMLLS